MVSFSIFKDSALDKGKRILKVLQFGTKTANECMPFGIDSSPIEGMTAIYADTSNNSESVIIGYINTNQIAKAGETRLFSLDANKAVKSYLHLKNDGIIALNGEAYTAARFEPLQSGINAKDVLLNAEFVKIALAISSLGGSYTPSSITTDISQSQSIDVKIK